MGDREVSRGDRRWESKKSEMGDRRSEMRVAKPREEMRDREAAIEKFSQHTHSPTLLPDSYLDSHSQNLVASRDASRPIVFSTTIKWPRS